MRVLISAFIVMMAGFGLAFSAQADDLMAPTYENTVVVTYPDGTVLKMFFEADGTYTTSDGGAGTWAVNDAGEICTTSEAGENCSPLEERAVGDSWETTDAEGNVTKIEIVAGRG